MLRYQKIPLEIELHVNIFGDYIPKKIIYDGCSYTVDKVLGTRIYTPPDSAAFCSKEYSLIVEGALKKIYRDGKTNVWFSMKPYHY